MSGALPVAQHSQPDRALARCRVLVVGLGMTGQAVAHALAGRVAQVVTTAPVAPAEAGEPLPDVVTPTNPEALADLVRTFDLLVTSPGIRPTSPILSAAAAENVPIWSEVELAWQLRVPNCATGKPAPWLVVTGTNGKTTTVGMLEAMLLAAGQQARAVGNVGTPLITAALDASLDVLALELSSFQLHFTHTMAPEAAAILNIAPDHLDWHGSLAAYTEAKARVFRNVESACVYNVQDLVTQELAEAATSGTAATARPVGCTLGIPRRDQLGVVEDALVDRAFHLPTDHPEWPGQADELATFADLQHLGGAGSGATDAGPAPHTVANALAAAALARAHGVADTAVRQGLRRFQGGAHRLHVVANIDQVAYVDDSKATNAHAAAAALIAYPKGSVVWLCGGLAKGAQFDDLVSRRGDRMRAAVVIGTDPTPFTQALDRHAPNLPVVVIAPGETGKVMREAVAAAQALAQPGDTVLLAPAGASQDQFRSYAHRGDEFAQAVQVLAEGD